MYENTVCLWNNVEQTVDTSEWYKNTDKQLAGDYEKCLWEDERWWSTANLVNVG